MQFTMNYGLRKPDDSDAYDKANDNANMDTIDAQLKANADAIAAHTAATTGVHGATSAVTPNAIVQRDASGRAQFAEPSDPADAATKGYVDNGLDDKVSKSEAAAGTGDFAKYIFGDNLRGVTLWATGIDNIGKAGFYYVATDRTNTPTNGDTFTIHTMDANTSNTNTASQVAIPFGTNKIFFRVRTSGTWGAWQEIWHSGNNTSSFNNNGWRKLADGTIEQWGRENIANGSAQTVTFPIAFPNAVYAIEAIAESGSAVTVSVSNITNSSMDIVHDYPTTRPIRYRLLGK